MYIRCTYVGNFHCGDIVFLCQIGSLKALISVDFDESSMEMTDEISEYLAAVDDVLTYYNENGQVKYVSTRPCKSQAVCSSTQLSHCFFFLILEKSANQSLTVFHNIFNYLMAYVHSWTEPVSNCLNSQLTAFKFLVLTVFLLLFLFCYFFLVFDHMSYRKLATHSHLLFNLQ